MPSWNSSRCPPTIVSDDDSLSHRESGAMSVETVGRAVGIYRRTAVTRSAIALLIANAIPIVGVLFFGWSLITILVLYWVENGIVGFWNVPKIALAQGSFIPTLPDMPDAAARAATLTPEQAASLQANWRRVQALQLIKAAAGPTQSGGSHPALARLQIIPRAGLSIFFLVHYGIFWLVHGIFVFTLPMFSGMAAGSSGGSACDSPIFPEPGEIPIPIGEAGSCAPSAFGEIAWGSVLIGAAALFLSHGASFLLNYVGNGEYLRTSAPRQMMSAYGRVIALHVTILLGGFVIAFLGAPIGALIVLVVLKAALDLGLHRREHAGPT
jgi:hypothetical protein